MLWSPSIHSLLPGACYVEESLEASLSRLTNAAATDLRAHTVDHFRQLYQSLGPPRLDSKNLTHPGIARVFSYRLEIRVQKLCANLAVGRFFSVATPRTSAKFALPLAEPHRHTLHVPRRLLVSQVPPSEFERMVLSAVKRLLSPKPKDDSHQWARLAQLAPQIGRAHV